MIRNFHELIEHAKSLGGRKFAIVCAEHPVALQVAAKARETGIAEAVLIGDSSKISALLGENNLPGDFEIIEAGSAAEAAQAGVRLAREGAVDVILKGKLMTSDLLRAVLNKKDGIRTGRLLSDVFFYEDAIGEPRLVGLTDGGINVAPSLEEKKQIIENAVEIYHKLGVPCPKVALLSVVEVVSEKVPSTVDAQKLTEMGIPGCEVFGPLALDGAVSREAALAKGIESDVAGNADILVMPNIEAGNISAKMLMFYANPNTGHVIMGAKVPVLIPSRVESMESKLNSVAMGVVALGKK